MSFLPLTLSILMLGISSLANDHFWVRALNKDILVPRQTNTSAMALPPAGSPMILTLNSTALHDAPVVDGRWQIANVSIPADWMCVRFHDLPDDDPTSEMARYICLPQRELADRINASIAQDVASNNLLVGLVLVGVFMAIAWAALVVAILRAGAERKKHEELKKSLRCGSMSSSSSSTLSGVRVLAEKTC